MSQSDSLDRVQFEVNRVLELLGRVFQADKVPTSRATALANVKRLKNTLPQASRNLHTALDEIDEQLQYAKLVLRRDLAVKRAKQDAANDTTSQVISVNDTVMSEPEVVKAESAELAESADLNDQVKTEGDVSTSDPVNNSTNSIAELPTNDITDAAVAPAAEAPSNDETKMEDDKTSTEDTKHNLKLETTQASDEAKPAADDSDRAPDTAFSNNADIDSLFNDPVSAGGLLADSGTANDTFDFGDAANPTDDFDFDEFSANLDNNNGVENMPAIMNGSNDFSGAGLNVDIAADYSTLFEPSQDDNAQLGQQTETDTAQDFNPDDLMDFTLSATSGDNGTAGADELFDFDYS